MRIGIMFDYQQAGPDAISRLVDDLRQAVEEGFESAWLPQMFGMDALTALAVAGNRVPGIQLGVGVVPTYPRHPGVLAQQARTTALAVGPGRLSLGIGVSGKFVIEQMYGYDYARPVGYLREYLSVLSPLLDGQSVSYAGETIRANLALDAMGEDRIPVLVGALGSQMLRLAGGHTDGAMLWLTGPATIRSHVVPPLSAAATAAGRLAPRVVCLLPVCVTDRADEVRAVAAETFEMYGTLPNYRAVLDREGAEGPADVAVIGTEEQVAARIREIFAAGATEFVGTLFTGGESAARTRALLAELAA
ncbi:TIGR03564 family F420-dependent LLM class oxidoreductase [Nocardia iowensis]|uniref:TIGR03564 family F420-dependent LLM class oxidoreductase n=1 Tax=Nocardia iowensis TaxID=204891 RepID=A0ABX8S1F6_NOCIO|nr:TIGR03564 family F420-dependent LLM class oxidoreductase [Nocardia iowensis]QXN94460.1 TIGR03564 family F420-dependent LLM class oxidoreductase [Nocardia iowensis]